MTNLPRIFVSSPLSTGQKITLDAAASKHILQVLRLRQNNPLIIFNNTEGEFQATITATNKGQAGVSIDKFVPRNSESPLKIHLGQGVSRGEKMDFTIQKAVELGVYSITPLFTEYCNVKLQGERLEKKLGHWQKVAISAAEQSGRCYVSKILPAQNLASWLSSINQPDLRLVFDPEATENLNSIKNAPTAATILVGPEGGLNENEIEQAKKNKFLPLTLGPRILRTETAALAAISILQAKWGDI